MDDRLIELFKLELETQCKMADIAAEDLDAGLASSSVGRVWGAIQGVLIAAGNAAKLLWGSQGPEVEAMRKPLRDLVGVADDSPLRKRTVRNAFEHFDERLVEWFEKQGDEPLAIRSIAPTGLPLVSGPKGPPAHFGRFDPQNGIVIFWNKEISLIDLLRELRQIQDRLAPQ